MNIISDDITAMTTRVAVLVPILQDAFGGTRTEEIPKEVIDDSDAILLE